MARSKYAVRITMQVTHLSSNRVDIKIIISEGLSARIQRINIVGAHAFKQSTLVDQLKISTPGLLSFITGDDKYSQVKMAQSLQLCKLIIWIVAIFIIMLTQYKHRLARNHKYFYITINIHEGAKYTFGQYTLKGKLILPASQLQPLVTIVPGKTFSRSQIIATVKAIDNKLADIGYAFASVNPVPVINKKTKTVAVNFYVHPGNRMYIKNINFYGNNITNDNALRERLKIAEGATYSKIGINQSSLAFQQLPYIEQANEKTVPVPGTTDQVNVNYHIHEKTSNSVSFNVGYSELDKFLVGASLKMPDVLGTGNIFNINAQLSKPYQSLSFTFTQPYFTMSGISQSITLFGNRVDNSKRDLINYSTNAFGGNLNYSVPLSTWSYFNFGGGYEYTKLLQPQDDASATVSQFVRENGQKFNTVTLTAGWSRNDTNNPYFPTTGINANVSGQFSVPGSDLTWYKFLSSATWYHSLWPGYIISLYGSADFGDGYGKTKRLPFFDNFYGGGWGSVRGFASGSLGPRDILLNGGKVSAGNSIGGNLSLMSSFNFYFPIPFMANQHRLRLGWFVDMGNIYDTYTLTTVVGPQPTGPNFSNLRYSTGVSLEWLSPMGLIGVSLAEPLNKKTGDDTSIFNFSLGGTF